MLNCGKAKLNNKIRTPPPPIIPPPPQSIHQRKRNYRRKKGLTPNSTFYRKKFM
jgi:hypothetical protein